MYFSLWVLKGFSGLRVENQLKEGIEWSQRVTGSWQWCGKTVLDLLGRKAAEIMNSG